MRSSSPAPLLVAAFLVAVEGAVLVALAVLEVASLSAGRVTMGVTTTVFFLGFGSLLLLGAWSLRARRSWARGPALFAQLVALGLAWSFRGASTVLVPVALAGVALLVIAGTLHPASVAALEPEPDEQGA
ncbi:MAG: hypothetical protein ABIQ15_10030 [Nocardioides sp.]